MNLSWKNCFKICISVLLLFLCLKYSGVALNIVRLLIGAASPIILGLILAYILNILMGFYERHYFTKWKNKVWVEKSRKIACLIGAILTLCAIVALVIGLVLPELIECVGFIIAEIPPLIEKFLALDFVRALLPEDMLSRLEAVNWSSILDSAFNVLKSGIGAAFTTIVDLVSSVFSAIITIFIGVIFAVYLLMGKNTLQRQAKRVIRNYIRPKWVDKVFYVLNIFNESFHKYIVGQCTEAVILGALCMLGMLIFRFPYAGMIGALVGFMALIPVVGAFIGAGVGALMILTQSPIKALLFIVFIVVLQQLEGNLIYPRVVGKSVGLPALWVLAAVTLGSVMGIVGMLLAVPFAASIYRLLREDMERRELQRNE